MTNETVEAWSCGRKFIAKSVSMSIVFAIPCSRTLSIVY